MRAAAAARAGDLTTAVQIARLLLQIDPHHASALTLLGRAADEAGRPEAAIYYRAKAASVGTTARARSPEHSQKSGLSVCGIGSNP